MLQFSILTNVFIPSLPPKQSCTEGQMKWEVWEWLIPIISFSLGSSCYTLLSFFFFFFNCLDLFIALHLPTFDVNLILKARTYMLSTYHIVSKYRAWNILFVEQIVTTEIHCVVTMAPGTGLLYSSLNMVVFILLIHPRRLKTGKVKWIPKNTQFGGSGGARFFWPQSLYSFRANRLDLVKSDMN